MIVPMSAVFASLTALLFLALSFRVVMFRLKYRKGMGITDDLDFQAADRAQANLVEYAPFALILLALGELNGVASQLVYWVGVAFIAGRVLHAWGMISGRGGPHKARMAGILLTWLTILVMIGLVLWNVFRVNG